MYKLPYNRADIIAIGNYVNHGTAPGGNTGYIRDGECCVVGDGDDNKPTYCNGSYAHDGTDFMMPVDSPVYAPCDGIVTGADESAAAGLQIEIRSDALPGSRLYFRYLHLSEMMVSAHEPVFAGELIGYSGDTGSLCGFPHLHLSIGTSSGKGNIDPLVHPDFKHFLRGLPFIPRQGHFPNHFQPFVLNSPTLTINGKYQVPGWNGQESEYKFECSEPILRLLNVSKYTDSWHDIDTFDLITELGQQGTLDGDLYSCVVQHDAHPGIYYYQADTGKGWTNPVRIMLKDRITL